MKNTWFLFVFALFPLSLAGQSLQPCLDSVLRHAQQSALNRNEVDWDSIRAQVYAQAAPAQTVADLGPAFSVLLGALGDDHGRVYYQNQMIAYWFGEPKAHQKDIDPNMWGAVQSGLYPLRTALLADSVGYIRLPGMPMGDNRQMSADLRAQVCQLSDQGARCWIIDLRGNSGGNLFPMLEGLGPLLGEGHIGSHRDPVARTEHRWTIRNGNFWYGEYQAVDLPNTCPLKTPPRIAVLTSRYTASSGEMVAITFKTRPNTRFFGEKTSGMITITNWAQPCDGLSITLSAALGADRTGRVYREYVDVDEVIPFFIAEEFDDDPAIQKALNWLQMK